MDPLTLVGSPADVVTLIIVAVGNRRLRRGLEYVGEATPEVDEDVLDERMGRPVVSL